MLSFPRRKLANPQRRHTTLRNIQSANRANHLKLQRRVQKPFQRQSTLEQIGDILYVKRERTSLKQLTVRSVFEERIFSTMEFNLRNYGTIYFSNP
jgi:hypothetical protein